MILTLARAEYRFELPPLLVAQVQCLYKAPSGVGVDRRPEPSFDIADSPRADASASGKLFLAQSRRDPEPFERGSESIATLTMHGSILGSRFTWSVPTEVGERVGEHFSWSATLRKATMRAMTLEGNRATILRFFREVIGLGDLDLLDALATEDYLDYVALPGQGPGRAGLKHRIAVIRAAFKPRQVLHDVIVDADQVAVRWTLQGVHSAEFLGLRPTGKPIQFDGVDMYQMRDGRMAAHWNVVDMWSFYQQVTAHGEEEE